MRCLSVLLIGCLALGSAEARIPTPSAERMAQFRRELAQLEKTFFDEQHKGDQFGDYFWRESKRLADRTGPTSSLQSPPTAGSGMAKNR
jgi:hypothetical protein